MKKNTIKAIPFVLALLSSTAKADLSKVYDGPLHLPRKKIEQIEQKYVVGFAANFNAKSDKNLQLFFTKEYGFPFFIGANLNEFNGSVGLYNNKIITALNWSKKNYNSTISIEDTLGNSIMKDSTDQTTNVTKYGIGLGGSFGVGNINVVVEGAHNQNTTGDSTKEISSHTEANGSIVVDNDVTSYFTTKREDRSLRIGGKYGIGGKYDYSKFLLGCDGYLNQANQWTKGELRIITQTNVNGNVTSRDTIIPVSQEAKQINYVVRPYIEFNPKNFYGYIETYIGAEKRLSGSFIWLLNNLVGSLTASLGQEGWNGRIGFYSNPKAFEELKKYMQWLYNLNSSVLHSDLERKIENEVNYERVVRNSQGVGFNLIFKKEEQTPAYGLMLIGSKGNCSGYINLLGKNSNNYEISIWGCRKNIGLHLKYEKINGKDVYGGGIEVYIK